MRVESTTQKRGFHDCIQFSAGAQPHDAHERHEQSGKYVHVLRVEIQPCLMTMSTSRCNAPARKAKTAVNHHARLHVSTGVEMPTPTLKLSQRARSGAFIHRFCPNH